MPSAMTFYEVAEMAQRASRKLAQFFNTIVVVKVVDPQYHWSFGYAWYPVLGWSTPQMTNLQAAYRWGFRVK